MDWIVESFKNLAQQFTTPFGIIVQSISIIGTIAHILALQFKKQFWYYTISFFGALCFIIHFALLGAWAGVALNFICLLRSVLLMFGNKYKTKANLIMFSIMFVLATIVIIIFNFEKVSRWCALLPCVASIVQTIGVWQISSKKIRWIQLFGVTPEWTIYNFINGSIGGIICEIFIIISGIIYLIRYRNDDESDLYTKN